MLRKARKLESQQKFDVAVDLLVRYRDALDFSSRMFLPKLLQRLNKFDQAVDEVQGLIFDAEKSIEESFSWQTYLIKSGLAYTRIAECFDTLRIISKREEAVNMVKYSTTMNKCASFFNQKVMSLDCFQNFLSYNTWNISFFSGTVREKYEKIIISFISGDLNIKKTSLRLSSLFEVRHMSVPIPFQGHEMDFLINTDFYRKSFLAESGNMFLEKAYKYWKKGDFNNARKMFQKVGFTIKTLETEAPDYKKRMVKRQKEKIIKIQANFAAIDPLYRTIISHVKKMLDRNSPVIQSEIYDKLSFNKEDVIYALYFADVLNDIVRKKKGVSYLLYPNSYLLVDQKFHSGE